MNRIFSAPCYLAAGLLGAGLLGCGFLKPSGVTPRSFVLTPLPASADAAPAGSPTRAIGMGPVKIPNYLFRKSMVMRQETNEIVYLETALWAERVDTGLQRVLAVNLATLLPTEQVCFSAWRPEDVSVEVQVNVQRFDVDNHGESVLTAWWRVLAPGGERVFASGKFSATRSGPAPNADPRGAASSMSTLAADLSHELAKAIKSASAR